MTEILEIQDKRQKKQVQQKLGNNFNPNIWISLSKQMLVKVGMQGGQFQHLGAVALKDLLPMENIVNKLAPEDLRVRQTEQECRDESNQQGS